MTERKMPDFATHGRFKVSDAAKARHKKSKKPGNMNLLYGFGTDQDFLPLKVRNELLRWVKGSSLDQAQQEKLVAFANELAQRPDTAGEPVGVTRKALKVLAKDTRRLANGLNVLSQSTLAALEAYSRETRITTSRLPADMTESMTDFLSELWFSVECLEIAAEYTREQLKPLASKGGKPLQRRQRALVANLAARHYQLAGILPPKSDTSWFANFVRTVGKHMGLTDPSDKDETFIGASILKSGIKLVTEVDKAMAEVIAKSGPPLPWCDHDWPLPVSSLAPQNCRKCGGGRNGAPDR